MILWLFNNILFGDFPGRPVVKMLPSNAGGAGSKPGQGTRIPHASWTKNQNIKQKQYCNKLNKILKIKLKKYIDCLAPHVCVFYSFFSVIDLQSHSIVVSKDA